MRQELPATVVDVARERCPDLDPRYKKTAAKNFPAPPRSTAGADGQHGLDADAVRAWVDRAESQDREKSAALDSMAGDYAACQGRPHAERAGS